MGATCVAVDLSDCRLREACSGRRRPSQGGAAPRRPQRRPYQDARLDDTDLRGARVDPTFWTTAKLRGAKIDISQALAYAAAHGLDVHGE